MIDSDAARAEFRRGLGDSIPIVIGLTSIGFIFGALARAAGLTWVEAGLMSAIVYAGPAQLVAVGLLKQGAGFVLIVLTTYLVNLRYVLYAASLAPHFRDRSPRWLALIGYGLVDAAYALSIARCLRDPEAPRKDAYYLAVTLLIYVTWIPASFLGGYLVESLPEIQDMGLEIVNPAVFIAILIPLLRGPAEITVALLAVPVTAAAAAVLPHAHAVLVTIVLISLAGGYLNWLRSRSST
ncbi:MAG: AzlC family ABC transporter permease [Nitrospinota bacterium]|nr:AzlC family ABC transporter permease [Nitrospinota bacterium]MDP6483775.1 AzlC family ABC transporter permease [Nitrospinota bacterium]MDP6618982.1 AzlC family ABC transporter permease [Nitrospinota bacterium]HJM44074.1 AzlC family ABC transporter permease [Nitrospinota bacterium]